MASWISRIRFSVSSFAAGVLGGQVGLYSLIKQLPDCKLLQAALQVFIRLFNSDPIQFMCKLARIARYLRRYSLAPLFPFLILCRLRSSFDQSFD